jgi:hypothetical protein
MSIRANTHVLDIADFRVAISVTGRRGGQGPSVEDSVAAWRVRSAITIERHMADHLRLARERAAMPQWALAERLGRPQSFIAKLERSRRYLHVSELVQLCHLMQRSPGELLATVVELPSVRDVLASAPPYDNGRR